MELDEEELKATKNREKTADEMFEELEYRKVIENEKEVIYEYKRILLGEKIHHTVLISKISKIIFHKNNIDGHFIGIGLQELQAINKKVEELGWKKIK